jgi:hypothetical protein
MITEYAGSKGVVRHLHQERNAAFTDLHEGIEPERREARGRIQQINRRLSEVSEDWADYLYANPWGRRALRRQEEEEA